MNISSPLISMAAAALDVAVHGVQEVMHGSSRFAEMFRVPGGDETGAKASEGQPEQAATEADPALNPTQLGQQMQYAALQERFETLRLAVHQRVVQQCATLGIDLTEPAVLTVDSSGRVLETGLHWDRADIERLFESDPELRGEVARLLDLGTRLYSVDPAGALDGAAGTPRLLVGREAAFFQFV